MAASIIISMANKVALYENLTGDHKVITINVHTPDGVHTITLVTNDKGLEITKPEQDQ